MKLLLGDAYPIPYPQHLSEDEQDEINNQDRGPQITLEDVVQFEWRFTLTVQFSDAAACQRARELTAWPYWGNHVLILEAPTSHKDGREFPAVVIGAKAYCLIIATD